MKPLIKKVKGVWMVCRIAWQMPDAILAANWCHQRNIKEGNYGVKSKKTA